MKTTRIFKEIVKAYSEKADVIVNEGGTRSTKTYSAIQAIYFIAKNLKRRKKIYIFGETMSVLQDGAMEDMRNVCDSDNFIFDNNFNIQKSIFTIGKAKVIFRQADKASKAHNIKAYIAFFNEANHISFDFYTQISQRAESLIIIDHNPTAKYWVHDHVLTNKELDVRYTHSTYIDNPFLSQKEIRNIESKKNMLKWWRIYGLGLIGFSDTLLFQVGDLLRFDQKIYTRSDVVYTFAFIDPAKGNKGDYFACVIFDIVPFGTAYKFFVVDVIFNNTLSLTDNRVILSERVKQWGVDFVAVETNGMGDIADTIKAILHGTNTQGYHTKLNKETKILMEAGSIIDLFLFRDAVPKGSEYAAAINQLTSYERGVSGQSDDFPDVLATATYTMRNMKKGFIPYVV